MSVQYDAKKEYLQSEGDSYFERNFESHNHTDASIGVKLFYNFICNQIGGGLFPKR